MELSFSHSPWWIVVIVLVAGAASYWMYRGTSAMLPRLPRMLLSAFRFVVLCLIGLLLLGPMLSFQQTLSYPPIVAFLQDDTESLLVQRDSSFVREQYPDLLKQFSDAFEGEAYSLDAYQFGADITGFLKADSLPFAQTGTNIAQSLKTLRQLYQNQNLRAVVLATDGISTSGINPLFTAENFPVPIHTVLIGDTTPQQDVMIQELLYNEIAYLNNEMPIRVKVRSSGFDRAQVTVTLRNENKVLATQRLSLGNSQPQAQVDFLIKPEEVGLQSYQVLISRLPGEISYRNNSRRFYINVLETRLKIALFAGSPHPDIGALRSAFARDESYEVQEFILKQPGVFYQNPNAYNLEDFDLFILHNFPQSSADQAIISQLLTQVKDENKPVMYFVGMFTDLRTLRPLYDYMAVTARQSSTKSEEVIADFSREYIGHSTFTFPDNWINWVNSTPPLYRNQSSWQAKPNAEVYATARIKNIPLDYPVYALQNQLGRKNMVFLGENFWRWRAHSMVETDEFEWFDGWLFNNIKWLIVSDDKRKFKVSPAKTSFGGNEPVVIIGQVYDESYNPLPGVDIKFILRTPDQKENDYYLSESAPGQYSLEIANLPEGSYRYRAEGRKDQVRMGTDQGQFSIGKSNIEHFQLQADRDLLQQMALRTEGSFRYARELPALATVLKELPTMRPKRDIKQSRTPLLDFSWLMALMLLLAAVEWIVRKVYSLL